MIEFITDSTSDIPPALAERLGVRVLPLVVNFGEESFLDGVDISKGEFYERLRHAETLPTTSQINPEAFASVFQEVVDRGNQAVGVFVSSELSGTFQSAMIAKDLVGSDAIHLVDSRGVAISLRLLIHEAVNLREKGCSAQEIQQELERLRDKIRLFAVVDTLKYLKMGGRISAATAVVGGVLGISPIVTVEGGKVLSAGKARGRKAGAAWVLETARKEELDFSRPIVLGHTDCPEAMETLEAAFGELMDQFADVYRTEIGAVVGTHAGPGAAGIAYFVK